MTAPVWRPDKLQEHYDKRLKEDDQCWRELLNINRSMTKGEYEKESYRTYQIGAIEFEAWSGKHGRAHHRVDKRTVLAITSMNRKTMRTCYHKHYSGKHDPDSTIPSLENLSTFIDELDADIGRKKILLFRIDPVKENLSRNQIRKFINGKLKPLRDKRTEDE